MEVLFVSEGALGIGTVGHARVEPAVRAGLAGHDDVRARFVTLPPLPRAQRALVRGVPGANRLDVDLQPVRWHLLQALRARRLIERELRRQPADVLHVVSHSIAMGLGDVMRQVPTFLSADVGVWPWRTFGQWRPVLPHSRAALAPSLALERRALRRAATVLAWSEWARADLLAEVPEADIVVHPPGIDTETFRPVARRPRDRPRVLFVGGHFASKGGPEMLAALERVGPDRLHLDIVTFDDVPAQPGTTVHRNVDRTTLLDLQQQADIAVMPSQADSFSWAVLEAMSCGAAVVSTQIGAIPELLDDGRAGMLVPPGDAPALAAVLTALLDDEGRRTALGAAARERAQARYDVRRQTARLLERMRAATAR